MNIRAFFQKKFLDSILLRIRKELEPLSQNVLTKRQRILFAMSFSVYEPCRVHDFLLSQALKLRGAEIVPLICGKVQEGECNCFGGIWGGYCGDKKRDEQQSRKNCETCLKSDHKLWHNWSGLSPAVLADYLTREDILFIERKMNEYRDGEHRQWQYEGMPVGQWALDVVVNNEMVGDETLISDYQGKLRHFLKNILILIVTVDKALEDIRPDVIVANDSYYYQWAVVEHLAKKRAIPFYSHWQGGRRTGWCYAMGAPAMALDIQSAWQSWKVRPLLYVEEREIDHFLKERIHGRTMILNTADPKANSGDLEPVPHFDLSKPTALLATNVIWDLAALNKEIQFRSMMEWVLETIAFFKGHPEWQLIIKVHPGEENRLLAKTRQQVEVEIKKAWGKLPDNVILLKPRVNISVYDLIDKIKIGLVYTTTVGLEIACAGVPVVTAGRSHYYAKGFTYDTKTKEEYFGEIISLFSSSLHKENVDRHRELARKFFYFYHFKYYMSLNFFDAAFGSDLKLMVHSYKDLFPGHNRVLDHVCDSILEHLPVTGENRWPPC